MGTDWGMWPALAALQYGDDIIDSSLSNVYILKLSSSTVGGQDGLLLSLSLQLSSRVRLN
jgi:hypothetical protein